MTECRPNARIEGAMVRNLVELSQYQPGCIFSRPRLQDETGSPSVSSFKVEQAPSAHTVPFNAFAQVLGGQAEIVVGGKPGTVRAGGMCRCPAGCRTQGG